MSLPGGLPPKSGHSVSSNLKSLGCLLLKRENKGLRESERKKGGGGGLVREVALMWPFRPQ